MQHIELLKREMNNFSRQSSVLSIVLKSVKHNIIQ